jgi:5-methylthioadenosine/S-adenosylhomocysteine deaminase
LGQLHQIPSYSLYSTLIYATNASDVDTVVIEGQVVMEGRKLLTLNEEAIKQEARHFQELIQESLEK